MLQLIYLLIIWATPGDTGNDILGFHLPDDPDLDPNTVCKTYPELTSQQYRLCRRYPGVTASAIQGVQIAIHECQSQFQYHRWNCSALERKNKNPHISAILSRGYKETGFAYAISSAGVTAQVAKACALGKLKSCGCDMNFKITKQMRRKYEQMYKQRMSRNFNPKQWKWRGCSHNLQFGENFAKDFLDCRESSRDLHSQMNLHNNKLGRLVVRENVRTKCKCHGTSGSCEIKTCWKATPPFRDIGTILKKKYIKAVKVVNNNAANTRLTLKPARKRRRRKGIRPMDLVFFERSPNYCERNPLLASPGTHGRMCNRTSTDLDNCETLCCGRGYDTIKMTREERCNCKFHWCCYVICQRCTTTNWVTVCK